MTITIGIRDLVRNSKLLKKYDYIDIEDKRTHTYKGLLVSPRYADELKEYLDKKIMKRKRSKLSEIMKFAGTMTGESGGKNIQDLTKQKRTKYED